MDKQNLYVALLNALFGVGLSLLLNGNLLIYALAFIALFTILLIERRRIVEVVFRKKVWFAVAGYATVFFLMLGTLSWVNRGNRDRNSIIQATHDFVDKLKAQDYEKAYAFLSENSKKAYPLDSFVKDNQKNNVKVQDFRIDGVEFNEFDKNKAIVKISSPFLIFGQSSMSLESVKEEAGWRLVFTPSLVQQKTMQASQAGGSPPNGYRGTTRRRSSSGGASISGAIRSLF